MGKSDTGEQEGGSFIGRSRSPPRPIVGTLSHQGGPMPPPHPIPGEAALPGCSTLGNVPLRLWRRAAATLRTTPAVKPHWRCHSGSRRSGVPGTATPPGCPSTEPFPGRSGSPAGGKDQPPCQKEGWGAGTQWVNIWRPWILGIEWAPVLLS